MLIHNVWRSSPSSGAHVDYMQFGEAYNVTIENSRFDKCGEQGVFLKPITHTEADLHDFLIENNFFGSTYDGFYILRIEAVAGGITVRNNSFVQPELTTVSAPNMSFIANVGENATCASWATYASNVFTGSGACSSTDLTAPAGFVDPSQLNLQLAPGAAAIDHGDPFSFPATDIDGQARPIGSAPDAGADEAG